MAGDAPFCIDTHLLEAGAQFGGTVFDTAPQRTNPPGNQFTPYGLSRPRPSIPRWPMRTDSDPPLAPSPSPPLSPTRRPLDPRAPPFTPRHSPPRLQVQTDGHQELAIPEGPSAPLTPQITVSPAQYIGNNDAVTEAVRQLSRSRRSSSPGQRPTGIQRRASLRGSGNMAASPSPMARTVSAPGVHAGSPGTRLNTRNVTQSPVQRPRHAHQALRRVEMSSNAAVPAPAMASTRMPATSSLTPALSSDPAAWLAGTSTTGYSQRVHRPHEHLLCAPTIQPTTPMTPRSSPALSRSRSASTHGRQPLSCSHEDCRHRANGKTFATPGALRKHYERAHMPECDRAHGCTVQGCPRRFLYPKDVRRHVEEVHDQLKARCEQCGADLARPDLLVRHVATVHGPRNYAAASPSMSSVTSFAMTPRSEYSFGGPSTPLSSFGSAPRPKAPHFSSFQSILEDNDDVPGSAPMEKSWTR